MGGSGVAVAGTSVGGTAVAVGGSGVLVAGALVAVADAGVAVVCPTTAVTLAEAVAPTFGVADVEAAGLVVGVELFLLLPPQATSRAVSRPASNAAISLKAALPWCR